MCIRDRYKATRYDVFGTYDIDPDNTYNGESYIPINYDKLPNINLDPITTTTWNIGYDMSIFNNRLSTSIDAYYRQVDNQLSNIDSVSYTHLVTLFPVDVREL